MNGMNRYIENLKVKSYETDSNANLKLYAFMNFAQEIAGSHADSLGFGYDNLIQDGVIWVLSRIHVIFQRLPKWKEEISIKTWHKGSDRLFGYRDFEVEDNSGSVIIQATSSWLVINTKTRRLQRIDNIMGESAPGAVQEHAIEQPAERIASPSGMQFAKKKRVLFSDVDINGHSNNAKYIEWALDCVEPEIIKNMTISDLTINFNVETRLGEEIDLYLKFENNNEDPKNNKLLFVEGKREETSIFQVRIVYN